MKTICSPIQTPRFSYVFPYPLEQVAFFDIETTGLSAQTSSLYLLGMLYYDTDKNEWILCQWFADNYRSEKEIILQFLEHLSSIKYLYHFNGKTFDIPYLLKKCHRYAITLSEHCDNLLHDAKGHYSIDLLGKVRPLRHALFLEKCNQTAIEHWLGIQRTDTFSGSDLIPVYSEYMQQKILHTGNAEKLEQVLLLHNHDDIEMMLNLCSILSYDEYLSEACTLRLLDTDNLSVLTVSADSHTITLTLLLPTPVPKEVTLFADYPLLPVREEPQNTESTMPPARLVLSGAEAVLVLPLYEGTLKYFFADYKNYYYLPKEDMAIHKSVAEFVDSSFRNKATAATCYTKKSGRFLPNLRPAGKGKTACDDTQTALFYLEYKDKLSFCELPDDYAQNTDFWREYLSRQFPLFR